jgi:hypothetical protein
MYGTCIKIKYPSLFWNCLEQECIIFPRLYESTSGLEFKTYEDEMPLIAPSLVGAGEQSLLSAAKMKPAFLFPCTYKI